MSKRSIRSSRNRMLGRVIMFVNVMVLGAVVLFVRQTKQSQDASKHEPQNLSWNGLTVTAGCREDKCLMKMEPVQSAGR
ncbi:MAG: hypothetical protein HY042_05485, partial [Spirochaetia bacterium]|nr:hypothetical protein [Spirochaetia bacterium]